MIERLKPLLHITSRNPTYLDVIKSLFLYLLQGRTMFATLSHQSLSSCILKTHLYGHGFILATFGSNNHYDFNMLHLST